GPIIAVLASAQIRRQGGLWTGSCGRFLIVDRVVSGLVDGDSGDTAAEGEGTNKANPRTHNGYPPGGYCSPTGGRLPPGAHVSPRAAFPGRLWYPEVVCLDRRMVP